MQTLSGTLSINTELLEKETTMLKVEILHAKQAAEMHAHHFQCPGPHVGAFRSA